LPRAKVVPALVGANIVVFLLWQAARMQPDLQVFMVRNFLVSAVRLTHGMWWTLVTSAFSHFELWHIALNMIVLWSFGTLLERLLGWRAFLGLYMGSAVVASVSHCLVSALLLGKPAQAALGASGAVSAVLLVFALLFPREKILIFGVIPIPALVGALLFIGLDVFGLMAQRAGGGLPIGHGAHLGGALTGFLYWALVLRQRFAGRLEQPRRPIVLSRGEAEEVGRLRDKIGRDGVDALTNDEREFLRRLHGR
jgi:membrane associated rhomboid family serine protease